MKKTIYLIMFVLLTACNPETETEYVEVPSQPIEQVINLQNTEDDCEYMALEKPNSILAFDDVFVAMVDQKFYDFPEDHEGDLILIQDETIDMMACEITIHEDGTFDVRLKEKTCGGWGGFCTYE